MSLKIETENVISSGIDEANRRIFFGRYLPNTSTDDSSSGTSFDVVSIEYAIRGIHKMLDSSTKKPIEIHMNSYGGDPYAMLYLHDLILASPCQFKFFGGGAIMSAASWVMAVCDERYLYKNARVMIHAGNLWFESTFTEVEIRMAEEKRLQDELETIYANNSRMPKKFWTEVCKRDLYLSAEEAILLGLADKIIEPKKRGSLRKMRQANLSAKIKSSSLKKLIAKLYNRIQYPVHINDITLNNLTTEEIDDTLIVEETKGDNNGEQSNAPSPSIAGAGESIGRSSSGTGDPTSGGETKSLKANAQGRKEKKSHYKKKTARSWIQAIHRQHSKGSKKK